MAKKLALLFVVFAAAMFVVYAPSVRAQAQGATTGSLAGTVVDPSGATVPDATVTITGPQGSKILTTTADGKFEFQNLTPGNYDVKVEKQGFTSLTIASVEV